MPDYRTFTVETSAGFKDEFRKLERRIERQDAQVKAHIRAGAGIVYDSDPLSEAVETSNKAGAVLRAIRLAKGGE